MGPLQVLVHLKEVLDLLEVVLRDVVQLVEPVGIGIAQRDRQHLLVGRAAVHQVEQPDGPGVDQTAGEDRDGHEHQDVQRIAVVAERAGQKAVVAGIVHGAVEHPVQPEHAELLVELVLVPLVGRDLDDRGHSSGGLGPVGMSCQGWRPGGWTGRHDRRGLQAENYLGVAGPRRGFRSRAMIARRCYPRGPEWRNGRRSGLKIRRGQPRASSTLASGTRPVILHPSSSVAPSTIRGDRRWGLLPCVVLPGV